MNINKVYCAEIDRIIGVTYKGDNIWNYKKVFEIDSIRETLVYEKSDGQFYDLLTKKTLRGGTDFLDKVGTEIVNIESLTPFNEIVHNYKYNLTKRKIIKLYTEAQKNNKTININDVLFEDLPDIKVTKKTKEDVLKHPEKYSNCDVRIRKGMFYTDEEKESYIEESLNKHLPSQSKRLLRTKRK